MVRHSVDTVLGLLDFFDTASGAHFLELRCNHIKTAMSSVRLLSIYPQELQFPFELNKELSCTMQLQNNTGNYVAFKVRVTDTKKYYMRNHTGIILPYSTFGVLVKIPAQKEAPAGMRCKDKIHVLSVIFSPESASKDITSDMFAKASGNAVDECKVRVRFVSPPQLVAATVQQVASARGEPSVSDNSTGSCSMTLKIRGHKCTLLAYITIATFIGFFLAYGLSRFFSRRR